MTSISIAVDFDGTLVKFKDKESDDFEFLDKAKESVIHLSERGVAFELYTARYGRKRLEAIRFIKKNKLPIKVSMINKKPQAHWYIDDHNIFCKGIDWAEITKEIERFL